MPKNLTSLLIAALDELNHLKSTQDLLELALEQLEDPSYQRRLGFLLDAYRSKLDLHLSELEFNLESLRKIVFPPSVDSGRSE